MRSPRVPDELDVLLVLADGMSGGNGSAAIEASEKRGQQELVNSDTIPTELHGGTDEDLIALGFVLGEQVEGDRLFRYATLPNGWKRVASDHAMGSSIVDELGRTRISVFFKNAFYDRRADMSIYSVSGYVQQCVWDGADPVLDEVWATREAVIEVAADARDRYAEQAKEWRDGIASGHYKADQVEEIAVRDEGHVAKYEALRARVAGETR